MSKLLTLEEIKNAYALPNPLKHLVNANKFSKLPKEVPFGSDATAENVELVKAYIYENENIFARMRKFYGYDDVMEITEATAAKILVRELAKQELDEAVAEFESALSKAEAIADKHNLSFSLEPTYGAGCTYNGEEGEWHASSQSC